MPWGTKHLIDGGSIPEVAWGSWKRGDGDVVTAQVEAAIEAGFNSIDTAQAYRNEESVGKGIREGGLTKRSDLFVTTKWSDGTKSARESLNESLRLLGLKYVDLYLIHHPKVTNGDILGAFGELEWLKREGYIKHAGVSNFEVKDLDILRLAGCTVSVNQIYLSPSVYEKQRLLIEYHRAHGIVTEAYSVLRDLTESAGGPVDKVASRIAKRLGIEASQVLFAWARSKGVVVVTSSTSKEHLREIMKSGDISLSKEDEQDIDEAGKKANCWSRWIARKALMGASLVGGAYAGRFVFERLVQ